MTNQPCFGRSVMRRSCCSARTRQPQSSSVTGKRTRRPGGPREEASGRVGDARAPSAGSPRCLPGPGRGHRRELGTGAQLGIVVLAPLARLPPHRRGGVPSAASHGRCQFAAIGRALVGARRGLGFGTSRCPAPGARSPFPGRVRDILLDELRASHCGHLPETMIAPWRSRARARRTDGQEHDRRSVAPRGRAHCRRRARARRSRGALLSGTGRPRRSRHQHRPDRSRDRRDFPAVIRPPICAASLPFDFVWFTPRKTDEDPCARFKKSRHTRTTTT